MNKLVENLSKAFEKLVKVTPEDLQRVYGEEINEVILDEESTSGRKYVGGEFILDYVDEKKFGCSFSLYFQDAQKKFLKRSAKTGELSMSPLVPELRDELKAEKVIKFDIPEPDDEARAEYKYKHSKPQ